MDILLGAEESQAVTKEFRARGFNAYSCDLQPCTGGRPEWHYQDDIFNVLRGGQWDVFICFPPCTHLAVSGAKHFELKRSDGRQKEGVEFFLKMAKEVRKIGKGGLENPVGIMSGVYVPRHFPELNDLLFETGFPCKPSQIIQPWQFGHEASKSTCLWLYGLPLLTPTAIVGRGDFIVTKGGNKLPKWYSDAKVSSKADTSRARSKTFPGIARAMASQWSDYLLNDH